MPLEHKRTSEVKVAVLAGTTIGGTEKAATIYAVELARRGYVVDYLAAAGPRAEYLSVNGVRLINVPYHPEGLLRYLTDAKPDVIHQHVPGYPSGNPLYVALESISGSRPKVIETNVFGRLEDPVAAKWTDFRCFISAASAAQALYRAHLPINDSFFERQTVLYYPTLPFPRSSAAERLSIRAELGVDPVDLLAVRIGRPGHKWATWECEAFRKSKALVPQLRLLLMEPPAQIWSDVERGHYGPGLILRRQTSDFSWLSQLYNAADLTLHASDWGESFGYTIAEAMAAGHPIITRSTPWGDNAQVELVENGVTGYVCWSVPEMERRLTELASQPQLRQRMGAASRERIQQLTEVSHEIDLLEEVIAFCLYGETGARMTERRNQALGFIKSFSQRERRTSEIGFACGPDHIIATGYSLYRCSRSRTRALLNRWRRRR